MKARRISSSRALWALILFTVQLLAWNAQSFCTRTYTAASSNRRASSATSLLLLHESDDNNSNNKDDTNKKDKNVDDESYSWAELQADEKLRQMEYNSSIKRKNAMLLPQRISRAIYTLGWTFVISGILLNSLGFAWISKPEGGIGIGTLDQRNFQRELYRRVEDTKDDDAKNNIVSRAYYNDAGEGYVKKWVLSMKDEQRPC